MASVKSILSSRSTITLVLLVIVGAVFFVNYRCIFDEKPDLNGDNIYYFSLAQSLYEGTGYSNTMGPELTPHMHFPPGYPVFMSMLMHIWPDNIHAMKVANGVLLFLGLLILFYLIVQATSSSLLAAAVCVLASCHAELLRWATMMMSEMLYFFITMAVIFIFTLIDYRQLFTRSAWKQWVYLVIGLILIAYTYFVRTMGISLILAACIWVFSFAVVFLIKGLKSKTYEWPLIIKYTIVGILILGSFMIAKTAWGIRNEKVVPEFQSDYIGDFLKKPEGEKMTTFNDWADRVKNNTKLYITHDIPNAVFGNTKMTASGRWVLGISLLVLVIYGLARLGAIGYFMLLFVGITFAVLLFWPEQYGGIRYFIVTVPLLLLGLCSSIYDLVQTGIRSIWKKPWEITSMIGVLILLGILIPRYIEAQTYYRQVAKSECWQPITSPYNQQYIEAAEWCKQNLSKESVVMCRKPEIFYYYSQGLRTISFPQYATIDEVMTLLEKKQPDYVLIDWGFKHAFATLYPAIEAHPEKFEFVCQWGECLPDQQQATILFAYKTKKRGRKTSL